MSSVEVVALISVEDYLAREERSQIRHEYIEGHVYAMVGASRRHNLIALALVRHLHAALRGSDCRAFASDLKVQVGERFYYPDVVVSCGGALEESIERSPRLVVEVLSPRTESRDRMEKRLAYQSLPSLHEYVLIAQDRVQIEIYRRRGDGWELERCDSGDEVCFESVDARIGAKAIYEDVL